MRISEKIPLPLLIPLLAVLLIVTLPITLPIAAAQSSRSKRRFLADAEVACCVVCAAPLGKAAIERADVFWSAQLAKLRAAHPFAKLRIVRRVYAVCVRCGTEYGYDEDARGFHVLENNTDTEQIRTAPA